MITMSSMSQSDWWYSAAGDGLLASRIYRSWLLEGADVGLVGSSSCMQEPGKLKCSSMSISMSDGTLEKDDQTQLQMSAPCLDSADVLHIQRGISVWEITLHSLLSVARASKPARGRSKFIRKQPAVRLRKVPYPAIEQGHQMLLHMQNHMTTSQIHGNIRQQHQQSRRLVPHVSILLWCLF